MKHVFVTFLLTLLLFSCQKQDKPNPFIEANKMEDILYDVAVLSGVQSTNSFAIDTIKAIGLKDIFKKYQIDSLAFMENNRYYITQKKSIYYNMQMRVMDRLKKEKEKIDSLMPEKQLDLPPLTSFKDTVTGTTEHYKVGDEKISVSKEDAKEKTTEEVKYKTKRELLQRIKMNEVAKQKE